MAKVKSRGRASELRQRAEKILTEDPQALRTTAPADIQKLIHELSVHQIELEMQNEELRHVQLELQETRDKYLNLYDLAPTGYFTLDQSSLIVDVNLAGSELLGSDKHILMGAQFTAYISPDSQDAFYLHLREVLKTSTKVNCALKMLKADGTLFSAQLITMTAPEKDGNINYCRTAVIDITERKKAERELRLRAELLDNAGDSIFLHTLDGKFSYVNAAACQSLGYSIDELLKLNLSAISAPGVDTLVQWKQLLDKGQAIFESAQLRKDGSVMDVEVHARIVEVENTRLAISVVHDIAERKQAEEQIKHLTVTLQSIRNVNQLIVRERNREKLISEACSCITETGSYSNAYITVLDGSGKLLTHAESGWGSDFLPLLEKLKLGEIPACGRQALEEETVLVFDELTLTCTGCPILDKRDNKVVFTVRLEHAGNVYGFMSVSIKGIFATDEEIGLFKEVAGDISFALYNMALELKRKELEESLIESEEKYRDLYFNAPIAYFSVGPDGFIKESNKAAQQWLGYSEEEFRRIPVLSLYAEESTSRAYSVFDKRFNQHLDIVDEEMSYQRKDGKKVFGLLSATLMKDKNGQVVASRSIVRDITEHKQMQEQLLLNDRLASIGELASGIAHELNNPLTAVMGFSELLLEKDLASDVKEDLQTVYDEAQRAGKVVKNLLTFARKHPVAKQLMNVNSAIEEVLELRAYEHKLNNIQVVKRFAPDLPEIKGDLFQLEQVFLNIICNAEYFMLEAHGGGTLTITTEQADNLVRIFFADDGPGLEKENQGNIFNPFFTTKPVGKGTGLGLSISHGIISTHGGKIYTESELGKGTTFIMELPVRGEDE